MAYPDQEHMCFSEGRAPSEFCVKLQISATETFEMLNKAFPNDAPKRTTVFEWHSRFKAGRISIEDDPRQGRPKFQRTDENVQKITDLIKENPRTTLLELEQDTGISKTTIGRIVIEDLMLKKTPAKFIPRFLTNEQKLCRLATCEDMMEMTRMDPEWKDKIITGDETWVYGYDPETKPQSAEWRDRAATRRASSAFFASGECMDPGGTPNMIRAESPSKAEKKPVRLGFQAQLCADLSAKENIQKNISISSDEFQKYVNPPAGGQHANPAAPTNFDTASFSEAAAQANRSWADLAEDNNPEHEDNYTTVQRKKRRRGSAESPAAAAPSSNIRGAGAIRRPRSSTGWAPRAEEIRTTRAHIAEARARQASSTEDHCVYVERSPELEPFHYMRAIERMFGSTREVFQVTKMNGHFLVGLANRGMAERLVNEGLEVEGTLHRAFPFRKRAERITVGNLPFFVGDATVISALSAFGRVTSIAPKLMKAGPYVYNDGRREAFIILREGMTIERLPTRLDISIKGEAWPAYLSSGIRCSRCRGQGHRRANCPLLAGRTNAPGPATPTSPTSVPSATAPGLPQQPSAQPPPSVSPSPTMELSDVPPTSRAGLLPPAAPRPPPPAPLALPVEDTSPAPPPVIPAPSLRAPGGSVSPQSSKSEPSAQNIEMTAIEESSASSTSSSRTSMRDDLVAFIRRSPTVSFAGTDALGLGREEVLDLLSSRTKAQRKGSLLTPPQSDALAGLIKQLLDLKPAGNTNVYKILHQVKSELKKGPAAVPPTPPLPAPRPAGPTPPVPHGVETKPAMATPPPPLPTPMEEEHVDHEELMEDLFDELNSNTELKPLLDSGFSTYDLIEAILHRNERALLIAQLSPSQKIIFAGFIDIVIWRAQHCDNHIRQRLANFRKALNS
ncbi:hypothetical protein LAZ67_6002441 [Cordylochernes scorpioides]|uniref:Mos1 transposase HTH domain-containing protein n=1 Tax=Cordylochernes scorpioides TaxID=51811 RepID=A0ABY6KK78_9ARAC|nr:hypothetical protein LAZ67_6002441 [Cordylochernes scorpioides]